ncbi:MAG: ATP-binding protein [Prevotella sp.]|nr:ATP-binding protein [Prevotella sp.]
MIYPIGIQNFEEVRSGNYVYVDKTAMIYKLATEGKYYFLSRPRRFGKSLLLSTFESYFSGRKELFEGLAISSMEHEWTEYPILHMDLNSEKYDGPESLFNILNFYLKQWESEYGTKDYENTLSSRFTGIIRRAYERTGKQVVILIDEYDKPLLQSIGNDVLQDDYRSTLKAFYGVLKSCDRYIRFAFLTGVTKFGKVSVFSDLNNLKDISMLPVYSSICGITSDELRSVFSESISSLACNNDLSEDECYRQLQEYYDGYHFCPGSPDIYNPFSLLNTLDNGLFGDYWFETGTPSFLVEQLKKTDYLLDNMTHEELSADTLNSIDIMDSNPLPLLYQSGYLTIKDYDKRFKTYRLDFPNREVREGFVKYLIPYYTPPQPKSSFSINSFISSVERGDAYGFMRLVESLFSRGDYQIMGDKEVYFQNVMSLLFMLMGLYVDVERHTTDGRLDMLVQTDGYIYIFELKIDQSADIALRQIEEKGYAKPFEHDGRKIYKIGINFSTEKRTIDDWKIA